MKINKQGKIKLDTNDIRVGNFVYTNEPKYIKLQDLSKGVCVSLKKRMTAKAIVLEGLIKENNTNILEKYAVFTFYVNSIAVDAEGFNNILQECNNCINRHKEAYGIYENISAKEDKKIIKEQKQYIEAVDKLEDEVKTISD